MFFENQIGILETCILCSHRVCAEAVKRGRVQLNINIRYATVNWCTELQRRMLLSMTSMVKERIHDDDGLELEL